MPDKNLAGNRFRFRLLLSALMISLFSGLAVAEPVLGDDVPWLAEVTQPKIPANAKPLRPILTDTDGQPITSRAAWESKRKEVLADWSEFLGIYPQSEAPLEVEQLSTEKLEHGTRTLIQYQIEPGRKVRAYLLKPLLNEAKGNQKLPAVVAFHGTSTTTFQKLVGLDGEDERHLGLELMKQGFLVICPENYLWEEKKYLDSVKKVLTLHPESRGMAVMLLDGMRAVDVLETLPEVDTDRISTYGHSLGAKEAMYLAAFDSRIQAAVASEGGVGMYSTNWEAPWYLGPEVKSDSFDRDHHELIALVAPRPFLVLGGESGRGCSDGDRSWPHIAVGQKVAKLYGESVRIGLYNHGEGHRISPPSGKKMIEWLKAYTR
ncbi:MAG: dienelactone hydrolase family protein [Pirellulaceae bacterium]